MSVAGLGFGVASGVLYGTVPQAYAWDAVVAAVLIFAGAAFNLWAGAGNSLPYIRQVWYTLSVPRVGCMRAAPSRTRARCNAWVKIWCALYPTRIKRVERAKHLA